MKKNTSFPKAKRHPLNVSQFIALAFFCIILLGTLLLTLPFSSRSGVSCGVFTALFTATSATCVTGLVLADTWTQWSGFGQIVILSMIELGGLGFMSAASLVVFTLRKKMNMNQQLVIAQSIGAEGTGEAVKMQKKILIGCLSVEGIGAVLLALRFWPEYGFLTALKLGVFHSVSGFCNAGFDILGFRTPGGSMILYGSDFPVCIILTLLISIGGVGFLVWDEIFRVRSPRKWSVYTKLVLLTSVALLLLGMVAFCLTEWNNPATLGPMSVPRKLTAALFQSATTRTAGFAGIDQGGLTDAGKALTIFFMLIGGSSGSTAGGLKTVTFIVLILFLWARIRGRDTVSVFHRTIPNKYVLDALTVFGVMIVLAFVGGTLICATSQAGFTDGLYEAVSALATVGLTAGITPELSRIAQSLMILYMFFGRVGILTISLGFLQSTQSRHPFKYADTDLIIG